MADETTTLTDEDIVTRVDGAHALADSGDDSGDVQDTSDTGDVSDTGDDGGAAA